MNSARCPLLHKAEVTAGESSASKDRESPRLVRLKLIPALQTTIILHPPRPLEGRCREARVSGTECGACGARSLDEPPGRRRGSARAHYEALPGSWLTTARPIPNAPVTSRGELCRSRGTYGESGVGGNGGLLCLARGSQGPAAMSRSGARESPPVARMPTSDFFDVGHARRQPL